MKHKTWIPIVALPFLLVACEQKKAVTEKLQTSADKVAESVKEAAKTAAEEAESVKDAAKSAVDEAAVKARDAAEAASAKAAAEAQKVRAAADDAMMKAKDKLDDMAPVPPTVEEENANGDEEEPMPEGQ